MGFVLVSVREDDSFAVTSKEEARSPVPEFESLEAAVDGLIDLGFSLVMTKHGDDAIADGGKGAVRVLYFFR